MNELAIIKCLNDKCPLKENCYRANAIDNHTSQSYSMFRYFKKGRRVYCNFILDEKKFSQWQ